MPRVFESMNIATRDFDASRSNGGTGRPDKRSTPVTSVQTRLFPPGLGPSLGSRPRPRGFRPIGERAGKLAFLLGILPGLPAE